jgi:energy-coupling factor transporter ATP-binding protein EcfA2
MKRILVIGNSGAGKSTLAKRLSDCLHLPFFPSDHFYWEPGWKTATADKVFQQVSGVIARESWILDGNFDEYHRLVWRQADCILWLDYSLPVILKQVTIRNFKWLLTREPTWSNNPMTFRRTVSGVRHAIKSYPMKKKIYPCWLAELSGIDQHRFRTKQETETWLQDLS